MGDGATESANTFSFIELSSGSDAMSSGNIYSKKAGSAQVSVFLPAANVKTSDGHYRHPRGHCHTKPLVI